MGELGLVWAAVAKFNRIPGTPVYNGAHDGLHATSEHLYFNADAIGVTADMDPPPQPKSGRVDWYDWRGLGQVVEATAFAKTLGMPPLALEDAFDVQQRPKYEERAASFLFLLPHLSLDTHGDLVREHITVFWTDQLVITFQEFPGDVLEGVRQRIQQGLGRVRQRGTTYLAYIIIDAIVDEYNQVLEQIEVESDSLENDIFAGSGLNDCKRRVHNLKQTVNELRRTLVPLREAANKWLKSEHPAKEQNVDPFLRDLFDNAARDHELTESFASRTSDLYQLYTSELAVETNRVVQVLTVVSAIFIPLTFMTGLYGMNFDNIPELHTEHGYFVLWGVMLVVTIGLLLLFKRRGWL